MTIQDRVFPYALLVPALVVGGLVLAYPLVNGLALSFTGYTMINRTYSWVGLSNFVSNFKSPVYWEVFGNSVFIVFSAVLIQLAFGLSLALLLNSRVPGRNIFRSGIFLIWIQPEIVTALLWMIMFNSEFGILNFALRELGLIDEFVIWLNDPYASKLALIMVYGWRGIPFHMVLILAGLQTIPQHIIEQSKIDGAGALRRFWVITLPYIREILILVFLLSVVRAFQDITQVFVLTNGGPVYATTTLAVHVYKLAFQSFQLANAAAVGVTWMVFLLIIAYFYIRIVTKREFER
jgi:multiple sugar transport system permease protein